MTVFPKTNFEEYFKEPLGMKIQVDTTMSETIN
jgi:hypothetical protein